MRTDWGMLGLVVSSCYTAMLVAWSIATVIQALLRSTSRDPSAERPGENLRPEGHAPSSAFRCPGVVKSTLVRATGQINLGAGYVRAPMLQCRCLPAVGAPLPSRLPAMNDGSKLSTGPHCDTTRFAPFRR